jgi:cytochrome c oxidase subunit 1
MAAKNLYLDDDSHHDHGNFITNYVFSTDHKVIGKQFLLTAML